MGPKQLAWVEALESGKYNQCNGRLCDGSGHCCLGVICELESLTKTENNEYLYNGQPCIMILPKELAKEYGLRGPVSNYKLNGNRSSLTIQNDHYGKTFKEIATFIREHEGIIFTKDI